MATCRLLARCTARRCSHARSLRTSSRRSDTESPGLRDDRCEALDEAALAHIAGLGTMQQVVHPGERTNSHELLAGTIPEDRRIAVLNRLPPAVSRQRAEVLAHLQVVGR